MSTKKLQLVNNIQPKLSGTNGQIVGFDESGNAVAQDKPTYTASDVGLGNVDNIKQYSVDNPPPYPVTSVNGQVGTVNLTIPDAITVDNAMSASSTNPVQNKVIKSYIDIKIPIFTSNDEGKVLAIVDGVATWTTLNSGGEDYKSPFCWIITPSKTSIYSQIGTVISETSTTSTSWECPSSGTYVIELHAQGGKGGTAVTNAQKSTGSYLTTYSGTVVPGGAGGGSGAKIELQLTSGSNHTITVSDSISKFDSYYCKQGNNGTNASINMSYAPGGTVGAYSPGMTCIAVNGENGQSQTFSKETIVPLNSSGGGKGGALQDVTLYPDGLRVFNQSFGVGGSGGYISNANIVKDPPDFTTSPAVIITKKS